MLSKQAPKQTSNIPAHLLERAQLIDNSGEYDRIGVQSKTGNAIALVSRVALSLNKVRSQEGGSAGKLVDLAQVEIHGFRTQVPFESMEAAGDVEIPEELVDQKETLLGFVNLTYGDQGSVRSGQIKLQFQVKGNTGFASDFTTEVNEDLSKTLKRGMVRRDVQDFVQNLAKIAVVDNWLGDDELRPLLESTNHGGFVPVNATTASKLVAPSRTVANTPEKPKAETQETTEETQEETTL